MADVKTETHPNVLDTDTAPRELAVAEGSDLEVADQGDIFDAVISAASKLESYAKAQDTILNLIVKRTFAGDWVCHDKESTPLEQRKANLGGAGAERIAVFLGINEKNWVEFPKEWSDDRKHFRFKWEADFTFRGLTRHAVGIASSQDKFFGFEHGQWKPIEDVREDDVKIAAYNECVKRGIVRLTGIRNIPLLKLKELGYDLSLVRFANFQDRGKQVKTDELKPGEGGLIPKTIQIARLEKKEGTTKATGKPWTRWDVFDKEGIKYSLFGGADSRRVLLLQEREEDQQPVKIFFKVVTFNNLTNYQLEKIEGVEE